MLLLCPTCELPGHIWLAPLETDSGPTLASSCRACLIPCLTMIVGNRTSMFGDSIMHISHCVDKWVDVGVGVGVGAGLC